MKCYVVGLMFNENCSSVCVIKKDKGPSDVVGRWNGVGGKIEDGETPAQAMRREFREETGVDFDGWEQLGYRSDRRFDDERAWELYIFWARSPLVWNVSTQPGEEEVAVFAVDHMPPKAQIVGDIGSLIPHLILRHSGKKGPALPTA